MIKRQIGARFRAVRQYLGITQSEIADQLNMNRASISKIDTGESAPNVKILNYLGRTHKINLHWLLTGEGEMVLGKSKEIETDPPGFDRELFIVIFKIIELIIQKSNKRISVEKKIDIVFHIYERALKEKEESRDTFVKKEANSLFKLIS